MSASNSSSPLKNLRSKFFGTKPEISQASQQRAIITKLFEWESRSQSVGSFQDSREEEGGSETELTAGVGTAEGTAETDVMENCLNNKIRTRLASHMLPLGLRRHGFTLMDILSILPKDVQERTKTKLHREEFGVSIVLLSERAEEQWLTDTAFEVANHVRDELGKERTQRKLYLLNLCMTTKEQTESDFSQLHNNKLEDLVRDTLENDSHVKSGKKSKAAVSTSLSFEELSYLWPEETANLQSLGTQFRNARKAISGKLKGRNEKGKGTEDDGETKRILDQITGILESHLKAYNSAEARAEGKRQIYNPIQAQTEGEP